MFYICSDSATITSTYAMFWFCSKTAMSRVPKVCAGDMSFDHLCLVSNMIFAGKEGLVYFNV